MLRPANSADPNFMNRLDRDKQYIHDETLRDGRQGIVLVSDALRPTFDVAILDQYYHHLKRLGVCLVDVGVPVAEGQDRWLAKKFAALCGTDADMCLTGFTRAIVSEIDATIGHLQKAHTKGVSVLTSPSKMHAIKFGKDFSEVKANFVGAVEHAGKILDNGQINRLHTYVEDSTRMGEGDEFKKLIDLLYAYIEAGATDISLPDTMGLYIPEQYAELFLRVKEALGDDYERVLWAAHTHNDFGNALGNTMAALKTGLVNLAEGTFGGNGPGEGVGNADLNTIIHNALAYQKFSPKGPIDLHLGDTEVLYPLNKTASRLLKRKIPKDAKVIGGVAGRQTKAGIHQDALFKAVREIEEALDSDPNNADLQAQLVEAQKQVFVYTHDLSSYGVTEGLRFSFGDMSGRKGLQGALEERGIEYDKNALEEAFLMGIEVAKAQGHVLTEGQFHCLAFCNNVPEQARAIVCNFAELKTQTENGVTTMSVPAVIGGDNVVLSGRVNKGGTITAFTKALDNYFGKEAINVGAEYNVSAPETEDDKGAGRQVLVTTKVRVGVNGNSESYTSFAFDEDQDVAGCKALVLGLNEWLHHKNQTPKLEKV